MEKMEVKFTSIKKLTEKKEFPFHMLPETYKSYRHVYKLLEINWGKLEFAPYINSLLFTDRNDRAGFNVMVLDEILAIHAEHEKQFPQFVKKDIWAHNFSF